MKILFIHPNFPGQYKHIARVLAADSSNQVLFISKYLNPGKAIPGVIQIPYKVSRDVQPETHRYLIGFERAIFAGQEVWRICKKLKETGFIPDIICAHPGWGEALFVKDIFEDTPLLSFFEYYYHAKGADSGFDDVDGEMTPDDHARIRIKNATNLLNLEACDWGISPTKWQLDLHPKEFHHKISQIHDGIDTELVKPKTETATLKLSNGKTISTDQEIITYVSRNFEPYRGFPTVMRAINKVLKERPNAQAIIVGDDGVSYGKKQAGNKTYLQTMLEELKPDLNRLHILRFLPYEQYLSILHLSKVHVYYTVPFVLSWSMLEAMAAGCLVVASNTAPVMEVINDGNNGLLADFFSYDDLARRIIEGLDNQQSLKSIRNNARRTIEDHYALNKLLPVHIQLLKDVAEKKILSNVAYNDKKMPYYYL